MTIEARLVPRGMVWCEVKRDVVRVSGPDAATYLQGQCSQDVAGLAVGRLGVDVPPAADGQGRRTGPRHPPRR